ncbi:MAG TPA: acetyl-CoA carboxylase, biotin carboxyl carrier protein, partial [Nitrospirae bacterium]|nr:acetyl-CoA carboxylase, biotin carboxyl carrier protein [Nitrospirota bacterium]
MELDEIKQLMELLNDSDITELQVERDGVKLKIKRERLFSSSFEMPRPGRQGASAEIKQDQEEAHSHVTISSPIVGIFHRAPSPGASPFTEVGSVVKKGQVLCIVEAMKL